MIEPFFVPFGLGRLLSLIQQVVQQELARRRTSLLGVVTAIFPHESADDDNNYEANVQLKHEDLELRRVPMAVGQMGLAVPPKVGDLVLVQFVDGDLNQPLITGRFYHADERPPLHKADEFLFEQRLPDDTLNHLRFTDDGSIFIQRDVGAPEDNSEAKTSIKIDGASGDIKIKAGESIIITITNDSSIDITADGNPISVTCSDMTIDCDQLNVNGPAQVNGDLVVSDGGTSTTISGSTIQGG